MLNIHLHFTRADTVLRWRCQQRVQRHGRAVDHGYEVIGAGAEAYAMFRMPAQVATGALPEEVFPASPVDQGLWFPVPCCLPLEAVVRCAPARPGSTRFHAAGLGCAVQACPQGMD